MSKTLLTSIICGAIVLILYCLFMLFLYYKLDPNKEPKQCVGLIRKYQNCIKNILKEL